MVFQQFNLFQHKAALENIIEALANRGMTMLVVTHEIGFAGEVADHVVLMDGGVVVEDGPPGHPPIPGLVTSCGMCFSWVLLLPRRSLSPVETTSFVDL